MSDLLRRLKMTLTTSIENYPGHLLSLIQLNSGTDEINKTGIKLRKESVEEEKEGEDEDNDDTDDDDDDDDDDDADDDDDEEEEEEEQIEEK